MTMHIAWQQSQVSTRPRLPGQHGGTLWLTGLSGAGKSTLAFALEHALHGLGQACCVLDGDQVRHGLSRDLGFSAPDRSEHIRRVAEVARLMTDAGLIVIVALISPLRTDRATARQIIGAIHFREVFVSTALSVCEARDPKGLYAKARSGQVAHFTGISAPYQACAAPDLTLDTANVTIEQALTQLLALTSSFDGLLHSTAIAHAE